MKINFTAEHFSKMQELLLFMLLKNIAVENPFGHPLNVSELLHTTSINGLNRIMLNLSMKIRAKENTDEWVSSETTQKALDELKTCKEAVNLIIGYKRFNMEAAEIEAKKVKLRKKIKEMEEEAKTPEEKLKEAREDLRSLEVPDFWK